MDTCFTCCETYNKSTKCQVTCNFDDCNYSSCKGCVRTYLLNSTNDPHCMNCKKQWNENFVIQSLNRSFIDNDYKKHRKELLVDREISKLPETMNDAEKYKKIQIENERIKEINEKMSEIRKQLNELSRQKYEHTLNIRKIQSNQTERKKFIMACPNNHCRGFLSTQYKCDLCNYYTCPDCHEIIGYTKNDEHICNKDSVESAKLIKQETKPCPTCGVRIYKISGCDQIWCVECKVAFSWKTGLIDNGVIHNPHFYEHMRNNNNGTAPRNPHDEVCGGLTSVYQLRYNILNKLINFPNISQKISNIHRVISHITYQSLVQSRENVRRYQDFKDLRIQYILNKKTKAEMATQIYRSDNLRKKYTELLHIDELFSVVGIEVFNTLSNYKGNEFVKEIEFQLSNLNKIRIYCNNEYKKISATYNQKVMNVSDQWIITNNKYKMNDYKPNINLGGNNHEAGSSNDVK